MPFQVTFSERTIVSGMLIQETPNNATRTTFKVTYSFNGVVLDHMVNYTERRREKKIFTATLTIHHFKINRLWMQISCSTPRSVTFFPGGGGGGRRGKIRTFFGALRKMKNVLSVVFFMLNLMVS